MNRCLLPVIAALATALPVAAQQTLTPELLWRIGRVSDTQLAPDGRSMLVHVRRYELAEDSGATQIFLLPLGADGRSPGALCQLTFAGSNSSAQWSKDGRRIAFVSSRSGSAQVWMLDLEAGGEAQQITDFDGGVGNMSWSPDNSHFAFTSNVQVDPAPGDRYDDLPTAEAKVYDDLMVRHWDQWRDNTYSHLFVVAAKRGATPRDLMSGQRLNTPLPPFGGGEQIAWSPDGKWLCYATKEVAEEQSSTDSELRLVEVASGSTRTITQSMPGYDLDPVWSPDGGKLAFSSMARNGYESDRNRIFVHDIAGGGVNKEITENFDLSVVEKVWAPDGKSLYLTADYRGTRQIWSVPSDGRSLPEQVTRGRWHFAHPAISPDGKTLYALRQNTERPYEAVMVDLAAESDDARGGVTLTDVNGDMFETLSVPSVEARWFEATDGKYVHAWLIKPPDFDPARKYPMLLYCQGGPQSQVGQWFSYRWNFHLMAAQGYVVIAVNRRGLPGFGVEWNEQISLDWGGQAMRDLLSATDGMLEESYVDKDRVAAVGASFGGYTTYWLMGHDEEDRFCSMIAHCGVFDLRSMYGGTEELFFVNWDLGGPYWKDEATAERYRRFSPSSYIDKWDTPLLVIHGQRDYRVPVTQGLQAFTAAQERGIKSRLLYYPDEGHWVLRPQNGVFWHREFFRWLDETCKNRDAAEASAGTSGDSSGGRDDR